MRHLPALFAALLLPVAQPLILGTAVTTGLVLVYPAPAQAQSAEAVAKVAEAITVRVEGATQGSGVLVKRDGNRYTVLTAWHVVSVQRTGEELDVYTPDGQKHQLEKGSIKRLAEVDMAVLNFSSPKSYEVAQVGDVKSIRSGEHILVAGFPVGSNSRLKFDTGRLVANADVGIDQGYQLHYTNNTVTGMSGGVVLKNDGTLIGMHGRGESDEQRSELSGQTLKTGINQGVPISYYLLFNAGAPVVASSSQATTADDYLVQARPLLRNKGSEQEVVRLTNQALAIRQSAVAYSYRAQAKRLLGDIQGAIDDYSQAISVNPQYANAFNNRGIMKYSLGDRQGAISDLNQALAINPKFYLYYETRSIVKNGLGDIQGAISDLNQAIAIEPQLGVLYILRGHNKYVFGDVQGAVNDSNVAIAINPRQKYAYRLLGLAKSKLGDAKGAIADLNQAISIDPQYAEAYANRGFAKDGLGDKLGAIADYTQAIAVDPQFAQAYFNRGTVKYGLGDKQGAIADYSQATSINPQFAEAYFNRGKAKDSLDDKSGACSDFKNAASLGNPSSAQWLQSDGGAWCRSMP